MPFYRVTHETVTIRLSLKTEKKFYPKWAVRGQSNDEVAIHGPAYPGMIGLYIRDRIAHRLNSPQDLTEIDCVELLVGDQLLIIPKSYVRVVSQEEIREYESQ